METFEEIEERFRATPVRLADHPGAAGTLHLSRGDSCLELTSEEALPLDGDEMNGWFDLNVIGPDGAVLYMHNALSFDSASWRWGDDRPETHSNKIFPNMLLLDKAGVNPDGSVDRISFQLEGFKELFNYRHAELIGMSSWSEDQINTLREMRRVDRPERGPFAPREIYVVHDFPEFFEFAIGARKYSAWAGGSFTGSNGYDISVKIYPAATIEFEQAVSLDEAVQHMWDWRCFFSQVAMCPLNYRAISVGTSAGERPKSSPMYLPTFEPAQQSEAEYGLMRYHAPLSVWKDREALARVMQLWLERSDERRVLRASINNVLEEMRRRTNPTDLVTLSAAVEGLKDIDIASELPAGLLEAMAVAAADAARSMNNCVAVDRIRGLLGALTKSSLSKRIASLGAKVDPPVEPADMERLAKTCVRIRNDVAHGNIASEQLRPSVSSAVQALAALLVRIDLEGCGMPTRASSGASTTPVRMFDYAIEQLRVP